MKLIFLETTTIKDLQNQFRFYFPFLKLEFFIYKHRVGQSSFKDKKLNDWFTIKEINPHFKEGIIHLLPSTTVADLEQLFKRQFALPVQVYRKARYQWVEATYKNILTLEKQNEMGAELRKVISAAAF